jgi:hypothetical protein
MCDSVCAMRVALLVASLLTQVAACKYDLDHATFSDAAETRLCKVSTNTQSCLDADAHSDFTFIQASIIKPKCIFSGCHDGGTSKQGMLDLRTQNSAYANLVGATSVLDPTRIDVVPSNAHQSFLMVMLGAFKPEEADPPLTAIPNDSMGNKVGTMPQGSSIICCQKLDAIERWINAGAANN